MKIWRDLFRKRVRHDSLLHKTTDALHHRWLQTDPVLRKFKIKSSQKTTTFEPNDDKLFESMFL